MFKKVLLAIIALPVLLCGIAIAIVLSIDPNTLKPQLEEQLTEQGMTADMQGDLKWQFFPNVGLSLNDIQLSDTKTKQALANIGHVSFSISVPALFKRHVSVNGINISDSQVIYQVNKKGESNWDALTQNDTPVQPEAEPNKQTAQKPDIDIKTIRINDITVNYTDEATDTRTSLNAISLSASDVNISGRKFPLTLSFNALIDGQPNIQMNLSSTAAVEEVKQQLTLSNLSTQVVLKNTSEAIIDLTSTQSIVSWKDEVSLSASLSVKIEKLKKLLQVLKIDLPETANNNVLQSFDLDLALNANPSAIKIKSFEALLDEIKADGNATINNFEQPNINALIDIQKINLDHYLPPESEEEVSQTKIEDEDLPPTFLPLELLRSLTVDIKTNINTIIIKNLSITELELHLQGREGNFNLSPASMNIEEGSITSHLNFRALQDKATVNFSSTISKIDIGHLLKIAAETDTLSGILDSDIKGSSYGETVEALSDNLILELNANSEMLRLNPLNIEKPFCDAIALIEKRQPEKYDWPSYSDLTPVKLQLKLADQVAQLKTLNASVQKLSATAGGDFDLKTGKFNFPINLSLAEFASSLEGCNLIDEKWRNRSVPLLCKGSLETVGPATCLPDVKRIAKLVKDKYKAKVKTKTRAQGKKLENKAKQKLQDKLGKDKVDELKNSFKGFLKN